ncbi:MAG: Undecaprenyl-diphosphatase [Promethearchaeota archaeon]|nr:MAG: Undecaprenyl-diphosphatase [Candidatus Lokiarchaeota archaeon]
MDKEVLFTKIRAWDKKTSLKFNNYGDKELLYFFKIISFFGRESLWLFLCFFYLFIWYNPIYLSHIGMAYLSGLFIIVPLKYISNRDRPYKTVKGITLLEREPESQGFPSWHSYNVFSQALILGFLFDSLFILIILLIISAIVSFSRIYLGVHYPTDAIIGAFLGFIGFLLTRYFLAPIFIDLIFKIEQTINIAIYPNQINPLLFSNIWYILISFLLFGTILFLGLIKTIRDNFKKR